MIRTVPIFDWQRTLGADRPSLLWTYGLPACGKTTWTRQYVREGKHVIDRINKDDMRKMMGGPWSKEQENIVLEMRDNGIRGALLRGRSVIVDDTNLAPKHGKRFKELAADRNANLVKVDFTNVRVDTCVVRDANRTDKEPVGEKVILEMAHRYLNRGLADDRPNPASSFDVRDQRIEAVIVDLDGTLAINRKGRSPYSPTDAEVMDDEMNHAVVDIIEGFIRLYPHAQVVFLSGRSEKYRSATVAWLEAHLDGLGIDWELFMRRGNDDRKDAVVKREMYEWYVEPRYRVHYVLDDRNQVVDMWRKELKIPCMQVWYGDF